MWDAHGAVRTPALSTPCVAKPFCEHFRPPHVRPVHMCYSWTSMSLFVAVPAPSGTGSARPTEIPPTRTAFPHRMDDSRTACSHWTRSIEPIERPHAAHRTPYSLQRRTRPEALTSASRVVGVRESEQRGMGAAGCADAVPRSGQGDVCEAGVHAVTE